jgi:hypothetical protein
MAQPHSLDPITDQQKPRKQFKFLGRAAAEPASDTIRREHHRGDISGPTSYGNALLRVAVIILSSVNAVMWEVYTQSTFMAIVWAAIVVGFIGWMIYDKIQR